jgi:hypothetical protein
MRDGKLGIGGVGKRRRVWADRMGGCVEWVSEVIVGDDRVE